MDKKQWVIPLIVVGALALAIGIALTMSSGSSIEGVVTVDGDALVTFSGDPFGDPAVGTPAPQAVGADFEGNPVAIGDGPAILLFLAHWCGHCQAEVPEVVSWLADDRLPDGVSITAIATSIDPVRDNYPPDQWLEREQWDRPTLVDDPDSTVGGAYGLTAFPYWVFVDSNGDIALRVTSRLDLATLDGLAAALVEEP